MKGRTYQSIGNLVSRVVTTQQSGQNNLRSRIDVYFSRQFFLTTYRYSVYYLIKRLQTYGTLVTYQIADALVCASFHNRVGLRASYAQRPSQLPRITLIDINPLIPAGIFVVVIGVARQVRNPSQIQLTISVIGGWTFVTVSLIVV
ncbi:hypothetical protein ES703_36597 [subsurface metagenome]